MPDHALVEELKRRRTMKRVVATTGAVFLFASSLADAGIVMDMVTRDASGAETDRAKIYAQGNKIRMEEGSVAGASMIFLGDSFIYVDHSDRSYIVMDEAMLDEVSAQMNEAMAEMEAQLAEMPAEQRAMVEEMMKGQMQGMMGQQGPKPPPPRVEPMGSGEWNSGDCQEYAVYDGDEKTQQVCEAALDDVDGADELIEAFRNMAAYMTKMAEKLPMGRGDQSNPGELIEQIDGFPVHTIQYENGAVVREELLDSVVDQDLDEEMFAAPSGYRQKDPFAGR